MQNDIAKMEFDIALLSCGSYAMPIGCFIKENMGKKAIYAGGILQLFFGIMGRRYNREYYLECLNPEAFIFPAERNQFDEQIKNIGDSGKTEALGAYF
jgi:hypothetical protein